MRASAHPFKSPLTIRYLSFFQSTTLLSFTNCPCSAFFSMHRPLSGLWAFYAHLVQLLPQYSLNCFHQLSSMVSLYCCLSTSSDYFPLHLHSFHSSANLFYLSFLRRMFVQHHSLGKALCFCHYFPCLFINLPLLILNPFKYVCAIFHTFL